MSRKSRRIPNIPRSAAANRRRFGAAAGSPSLRATDSKSIPPGLICVPTVGQMWTKSATAIFGGMEIPPHSVVSAVDGSRSIAQKRNEGIRAALRVPSTQWVLFIDDDMTPEPATLRRLWSTGKDVVGALYYQRLPPFAAAAGWVGALRPDGTHRKRFREYFVDPGDVQGQMMRVDWVGAGLLLVRRRVLEAMGEPWFKHPEEDPGLREDMYFSARVREAGFEIWVDTSLQPGHMASFPMSHEFVAALRPEAMDSIWDLEEAATIERGERYLARMANEQGNAGRGKHAPGAAGCISACEHAKATGSTESARPISCAGATLKETTHRERHLMRIIAALAVCLLTLPACSDSTGPGVSLSGRYTLAQIDGEPLPYEIFDAEILSGAITFRGDGTYVSEIRSRYEDWMTGEPWVSDEIEQGSYQLNGSRFTIDNDGDGVPDGSGRVRDDGVAIDVGLFVLEFVK